ncbi:MAG: aminomethyltransferase family protein [Candidatus Latescibacterota bacterium]|nr:MAG: aminomethyltransferase family protein [Candidatus Latescibacterota bacterium]
MLLDLYRNEGIPLRETFGVPYPEYFLHPLAEYDALVAFAGIIDLTHWRTLQITGSDRSEFLNAMITNDVTALEKNQGCHSMITTVKGKIISELFVICRENDHLVFVSQGDFDGTIATLEKHIIREDVSIDDVSSSFGVLAVEGPKAGDIVQRLFETGPLPKMHLESVERDFEKFSTVVVKNSCTGEDGYHLLVPSEEIGRIRGYLIQAARGSDGLPIGRVAWNIRRVEMGRPWYAVDFTDENFPQETRLDDTVSYSKGCFRGQETLGRLHHRGHVNRLLAGLTFAANDLRDEIKKRIERIGELSTVSKEHTFRERARTDSTTLDLGAVFPHKSRLFLPEGSSDAVGRSAEERSVGWITSVVYSPRLNKPLFLGYLGRKTAETGDAVVLKTMEQPAKLTQIDLPLR